MTREEAIEILKAHHMWTGEPQEIIEVRKENTALNMAIKALEQEPKTGHWKRISIDKYSQHAMYWYRCDRCGEYNLGNTDWCPNCGAKMESEG